MELFKTEKIRVAEFILEPESKSESHFHSNVDEVCYCLKGELSVNVDGGSEHLLMAGDKIRISSKKVHFLKNYSKDEVKYLVIQGVGEFDFITS